MKIFKIMVACLCAATFSVLKVNGQDTIVLKVLEENAPKYFNAPGMPRFSVIGKEREFYLGIGGVLTFKNCKLAEHLVGIPLERLILETDAPYMAPVPYRGKRNESRWMWYVVERLAEIYNCTPEHVDEVTTANAKALFVIKL